MIQAQISDTVMFRCIYALWLLLWGSCFKMHGSLQSLFSLYQQIAKPHVTYSVHELYHFGEEEPPAYTGHLQPPTTLKHLNIVRTVAVFNFWVTPHTASAAIKL